MNKFYIQFVLLLAIMAVMPGCSNDNPTPVIEYDPEIICNISGDIEANYEAQTTLQIEDREDGGTTLLINGASNLDDIRHGMSFNIYYNGEPTAGVYPIGDRYEVGETEHIFAVYVHDLSKNKRDYFSVEGSATITKVEGNEIKGKFTFTGQHKDGSTVEVKNGIFNVYSIF